MPTPIGVKAPAGMEYDAQGQLVPMASAPLGSTANTNELLGGQFFNESTGQQVKPFVPAPVSNPVQAPNQSNVGAVPPALPAPTASTIGENYITSVTKDLENNKQGLQGAYQEQQNLLQKRIDEQTTKISEIETLQSEGVLKDISKLSAPFRADLEIAQREKLYVNENFEANQKLTNELDSLLTQGNNLIEQSKKNPVPTAIGVALTNKTISDVSARAGVIQAVMSARNNQISQAYTLIDRSVEALNADRKDQLDYYKTLFNYYDKQKDEAGDKVVKLDAEKRKYLDTQIGILEGELKQSQTNAENLKQAMTDPDTALAYAQAGVTLNDSPEKINEKLAKYGYAKEVAELSNDMAQKGYTALISGSAPAGSEVVTTTDSTGKTKTYYKKGTTTKNTSTPDTIPKEDVYNNLQAVGIPTNVSTTKGALNKSFYDRATSLGIPYALADGLWQNIVAGNNFEDIRQYLRENGVGTEALDIFVQVLQGK